MAGGVNSIGTLQGKVNANGALVVALDGGAASAELVTVTKDAIGTTSTDGVVIQNTTDAAAGAQQYSPRLRLRGEGWKTDATAASQTIDFALEVQPVEGTSAPSGNLILKASINGGAFSTVGTFTSGGAFTAADLVVANGLDSVATAYWGFQSRLVVRSPADGRFTIANRAETNTYDITLADWGTTTSAEAVSLANDASVLIGAAISGTVHISYPGDAAIYVARGTANGSRLADGSATFTVTKDNAATVNFYYDAAGASGAGYYLQNKTGGALAFRVVCVGA